MANYKNTVMDKNVSLSDMPIFTWYIKMTVLHILHINNIDSM